jgi:methionyl-tRNA formyltransferase
MSESKTNIIFFGNNSLVLDCLVKYSKVISIICHPLDKNNLNIVEISFIANKYSIPIYQLTKNELYNYIDIISNLNPDLIVVCGYKYIIPIEIFSIPKLKSINIHPSYLPNYRGQHVINWAIANGEYETGVTIHFIDEGIDTGDIIIQKRISILFEDSALSLHNKIYSNVCELLKYVLNTISSGQILYAEKQDDSKASYFRPRTPRDGIIDWNRNGLEIYNLIRALVKPWPGAYSYIKGNKIIFWSVRYETSQCCFSPGEIINISDSKFIIGVKGGKLSVDDYTILDNNDNITNLDFHIGDKFEKESDKN